MVSTAKDRSSSIASTPPVPPIAVTWLQNVSVKRWSTVVALALIVAACTTERLDSTTTTLADSATTTSADSATAPNDATSTTTSPPTATDGGEMSLEPTPSQQEGPFYPVSKPADSDDDLTRVDGESGVAGGQVLVLGGRVLNTDGEPIAGATVEIWQTDQNGIYLHPGDPGVDARDVAFQGYGESVTGADGRYEFRTIDPGYYEPRPRHIHLKVILDDVELLTSQIYFSDDPDAAAIDAALVVDVSEADGILSGDHDLVVVP